MRSRCVKNYQNRLARAARPLRRDLDREDLEKKKQELTAQLVSLKKVLEVTEEAKS